MEEPRISQFLAAESSDLGSNQQPRGPSGWPTNFSGMRLMETIRNQRKVDREWWRRFDRCSSEWLSQDLKWLLASGILEDGVGWDRRKSEGWEPNMPSKESFVEFLLLGPPGGLPDFRLEEEGTARPNWPVRSSPVDSTGLEMLIASGFDQMKACIEAKLDEITIRTERDDQSPVHSRTHLSSLHDEDSAAGREHSYGVIGADRERYGGLSQESWLPVSKSQGPVKTARQLPKMKCGTEYAQKLDRQIHQWFDKIGPRSPANHQSGSECREAECRTPEKGRSPSHNHDSDTANRVSLQSKTPLPQNNTTRLHRELRKLSKKDNMESIVTQDDEENGFAHFLNPADARKRKGKELKSKEDWVEWTKQMCKGQRDIDPSSIFGMGVLAPRHEMIFDTPDFRRAAALLAGAGDQRHKALLTTEGRANEKDKWNVDIVASGLPAEAKILTEQVLAHRQRTGRTRDVSLSVFEEAWTRCGAECSHNSALRLGQPWYRVVPCRGGCGSSVHVSNPQDQLTALCNDASCSARRFSNNPAPSKVMYESSQTDDMPSNKLGWMRKVFDGKNRQDTRTPRGREFKGSFEP